MDDPWFIAYRGRAKFQMTPADAKGWAAFVAVMWVLFIRWALRKSAIISIDDIVAQRRAR